MKIKVLDVSAPQYIQSGQNSYNKISVAFKNLDNNTTQSRDLVSFKYPLVYEFFKNAKSGVEAYVTVQKEGKFWAWTEVSDKPSSTPSVVEQGQGQGRPQPYKKEEKTFETPHERKVKQRLIVRQASINMALQFYAPVKNPSMEDILKTAEQFENWVYRVDKNLSANDAVLAMEEDIPF